MIKILPEYDIGEPWRPSDDSLAVVVPILRKDIGERNYKLVEEVDDIDLEDSGSIGKVLTESNIDEPIFVRGGTLLEGKGTQSRAVQYGTVVAPEKKEELPTKCVHASHPVKNGASFEIDNEASHVGSRRLECSLAEGNQNEVWGTVNTLTSTGDFVSTDYQGTDDYVSYKKKTNKDFKNKVNELIQEMPEEENQVGIAVVDMNGIVGIEAFDHQDSWEALKDSIVEKYGKDLYEEGIGNVFEPNEEKIKEMIKDFLKTVMDSETEEIHSNEFGGTKKLENDNIIGEISYIDNKVVHFVVSRKEENQQETWYTNTLELGNYGSNSTYFGDSYDDGTLKYMTSKEGTNIIGQLSESPKSWSEIKSESSTRTKSKRLKEAQEEGLVSKLERANGKEAYTATPKGKKALGLIKDLSESL